MPFDALRTRQYLQAFDFRSLFVEELGWNRSTAGKPISSEVAGIRFARVEVAELGGVRVFEITAENGLIPDKAIRAAVHKFVSGIAHENLLIFLDRDRAKALWTWARRDGTKVTLRDHLLSRGQPGDLFLSKLVPIFVELSELDEQGRLAIGQVVDRLRAAFDVEKVTKRFFREFQEQHLQFIELIRGIDSERDRRWYASVLLNRLMFVFFLQKKGFVDRGERDYLSRKLAESRQRGENRYYSEFLRLLFFEGFAKPEEERSVEAKKLLGSIRYLNGGLFLPHRVEGQYPKIEIPDLAFANLLDLFSRYSWHLDDTPGGQDNEINPGILGYIFEKYINQKSFGAYYTRPEITEYLCEQTIHRLVVEKMAEADAPGLPPGRRFDSIEDLLLRLDAELCRRLVQEVLPRLTVLDPACGSGAFLVAAMKTLLNIWFAALGAAERVNDTNLRVFLEKARQEHRSLVYWVKKRIITENLYGVDLMEEAVEIAKLRLFLALVSSAETVNDLEPLPNIDFNLMTGNSLIGRLHVEPAEFAGEKTQNELWEVGLPELLRKKDAAIGRYRSLSIMLHGEDLRALRDDIENQRAAARQALNRLILADFNSLGIKFEQASWDDRKSDEQKRQKRTLTPSDIGELQPFHWGYEFDEILAKRGGFDVILANPPWEIWKPNSKEFFEEHSDLVTKKKMRIEEFEKEQRKLLRDPEIRAAWLAYLSKFPHVSLYFRSSAQYRHQVAMVDGKKKTSDINLYKVFLEQCANLLRPDGHCGIVIPSGIYTDLGAKGLREMLFNTCRVTGLFGFENRKAIFEGVDSRFKFVVLTFEKGGSTEGFPVVFMRHDVEELSRFPATDSLTMTLPLARRLSPDSLSLMEFRSEKDIVIAEKMLRFPLLGEKIEGTWNLELSAEFHMTNDSHLFKNSPGPGRLPLYEGKMIWQFDHRYAEPRYWVDEKAARKALLGRQSDLGQVLDYQRIRGGYRSIARSTDSTSLIFSVLPAGVFAGNSINVATLEPGSGTSLALLSGLFNSFVVNYYLRQLVSANINMFYIYQLPIPRLEPSDDSAREISECTSRLTCTRRELASIWREVTGEAWAEESGATDLADRARLRAAIEGCVGHLYDLTDDEFAHVLSTFPLVDQSVKDAAMEAFRRLG